MGKSHGIRCWRFDQAPNRVRTLFFGRGDIRRPRAQDWVLEVMWGAELPEEVMKATVARVQTRRQRMAGSGRYFALVPDSAESATRLFG